MMEKAIIKPTLFSDQPSRKTTQPTAMGPSHFLSLSTLLAFFLLGNITAWSPSTTSRRGFVEKAAGATFTVASSVIVGTTTAPEPSSAFAGTSDKVYQPVPNSLTDKVIIITGSSTGLGLESAKRLAAAGATTVLTTRSESKGKKAVSQVQSYLQERSIDNPNVFFVTLDLESLDSVRSFPQQFQDKLGNETKIDVLMNNAGVGAIPERELTKDGFERTFQVNHLGPFLLTSLLFPLLNRNGAARVINVASSAHQFQYSKRDKEYGLDMGNLNSEIDYLGQGWGSYGRTKLENILFAQELQRRADRQGMKWLAISSLHPGVVGTDFWRTSTFRKDNSNNPLQSLISRFFYTVICLTPPEGANTQVWLASKVSDPIIGRGQYYDENGNIPKLADFAKDRASARKLWERSEELLGIQVQL